MKPGCGAAARTRPASPPSVTFAVQCPGRRGHREGGVLAGSHGSTSLVRQLGSRHVPAGGQAAAGGQCGALAGRRRAYLWWRCSRIPRRRRSRSRPPTGPPRTRRAGSRRRRTSPPCRWNREPQRRSRRRLLAPKTSRRSGSAWLVAAAGPGAPRPSAHRPCGCRQARHPGSGPQASCTLPGSLSSDVGSGLRALRGPGVRQERGGPTATALPPGTRRRSPGFPGDSGLKRAFLETLKGELFVSEAPLRPACVGGRMSPGWAGTRHSRAPGGHHALCQSSGHKIRPICEPRNPRK